MHVVQVERLNKDHLAERKFTLENLTRVLCQALEQTPSQCLQLNGVVRPLQSLFPILFESDRFCDEVELRKLAQRLDESRALAVNETKAQKTLKKPGCGLNPQLFAYRVAQKDRTLN